MARDSPCALHGSRSSTQCGRRGAASPLSPVASMSKVQSLVLWFCVSREVEKQLSVLDSTVLPDVSE